MKKFKCFVCRKRSKWSYENIVYLRTKHSERTLLAVMNAILGEASKLVCLMPASICFRCVDRINEYDAAYEKMLMMEREIKSMICVDFIPKLSSKLPCAKDKNTPITYAEEMDADPQVRDILLVSPDGPVDIQPAEPSQNDQEVSIAERGPADAAAKKIPTEKEKPKLHCEECKKSFGSKRGLMVMWGSKVMEFENFYSFILFCVTFLDARIQ